MRGAAAAATTVAAAAVPHSGGLRTPQDMRHSRWIVPLREWLERRELQHVRQSLLRSRVLLGWLVEQHGRVQMRHGLRRGQLQHFS